MKLLFLCLACAVATPPSSPARITAEAATRAVVAAVQARMGEDVDVLVDAVHDGATTGGPLVDAVPAPGAKLGGVTRFVLRGAGATPADPSRRQALGYATVTLRVAVPHAHTARAVRRGVEFAVGDLVAVRHVFAAGPLKRLPTIDDALHGRALRNLPAGACLTPQAFVTTPAVRAGADVAVVMRSGGIEVRAALVAVDSGEPGEMVRVVNPRSRKTFRARVVSRDVVEVSHE
ncbi:MAG TPA: flagellar basal body P-ring formation chaperone FlgA [Vicinamibacterales bacterium]|nr:flagellar basal body P-ring formation chaperone FlgA [Vicinamibacterales bacterium]